MCKSKGNSCLTGATKYSMLSYAKPMIVAAVFVSAREHERGVGCVISGVRGCDWLQSTAGTESFETPLSFNFLIVAVGHTNPAACTSRP